jgi:hypothetical protein
MSSVHNLDQRQHRAALSLKSDGRHDAALQCVPVLLAPLRLARRWHAAALVWVSSRVPWLSLGRRRAIAVLGLVRSHTAALSVVRLHTRRLALAANHLAAGLALGPVLHPGQLVTAFTQQPTGRVFNSRFSNRFKKS